MSSSYYKSEFQIRPKFTLASHVSVEDICSRFKIILLTKSGDFSGKVRHGYISLFPAPHNSHYWSPHLSVTVEKNEDNPNITLLHGLYGPAPSVWTMFVFFYAILALVTVIVSVIGFANISIGESGNILWALPFLVILLLSIYAVTYFGQRKGHEQIDIIDEFFMTIMDDINKKNPVPILNK